MKKELNIEEFIAELRKYYVESYNALHIEHDHQKSNRLVKKYIALEQKLVLTPEGINAMSLLLDDEDDIVRYYSASALISLFPKKCIKILKDIEKKDIFVSYLVKYILLNYKDGNNYIQNFLSENRK